MKLLSASPAYANGCPAPPGGAPVVHVGPIEQALSRRLDLSIGQSILVDLPRDAKEVFVAKPTVANAVVRSTRKLFIIGMEEGVFPHSRSIESGDLEEERRLAYVGITRAERELYLTYTRVRTLYGARDWKMLFKLSPLRYHYAGYALFGLAANQLTIWGPSFFNRVRAA